MNKLAFLMKLHKKTKEDVASAAKKSVPTVENWMVNKTQPNATDLLPIFEMFGITQLSEFVV